MRTVTYTSELLCLRAREWMKKDRNYSLDACQQPQRPIDTHSNQSQTVPNKRSSNMTKLSLKLVSDLTHRFIAVKYCEGPKTFQATQFEDLQILSILLGEA